MTTDQTTTEPDRTTATFTFEGRVEAITEEGVIVVAPGLDLVEFLCIPRTQLPTAEPGDVVPLNLEVTHDV